MFALMQGKVCVIQSKHSKVETLFQNIKAKMLRLLTLEVWWARHRVPGVVTSK